LLKSYSEELDILIGEPSKSGPNHGPTPLNIYGELKLALSDLLNARDREDCKFYVQKLGTMVRANGFIKQFKEVVVEIQDCLGSVKKSESDLFDDTQSSAETSITSNLSESISSPSLIAAILNLESFLRGSEPAHGVLSACLLRRLSNIESLKKGTTVTVDLRVEQLIKIRENIGAAPANLLEPTKVDEFWMSYLSNTQDGTVKDEAAFRLLLSSPEIFFCREMFRYCASTTRDRWSFASCSQEDELLESLAHMPLELEHVSKESEKLLVKKLEWVPREKGRCTRGVLFLNKRCSADELTQLCGLGVVYFDRGDPNDATMLSPKTRTWRPNPAHKLPFSVTGKHSRSNSQQSCLRTPSGDTSLPSQSVSYVVAQADPESMELKSSVLAMCWTALCVQRRIAGNKGHEVKGALLTLVLAWASFPPITVSLPSAYACHQREALVYSVLEPSEP
jgi:hypothetical protein